MRSTMLVGNLPKRLRIAVSKLAGSVSGTAVTREAPIVYFHPSFVSPMVPQKNSSYFNITERSNPADLIVAGYNLLMAGMICASLTRFDYRKIPMLYRAFDKSPYPLAEFCPDDISIISNRDELQVQVDTLSRSHYLDFEPHFGWKGHVESEIC